MELGQIIGGIVTGVILTLFARLLEPKVKIVFWTPNRFVFNVPPPPPAPPGGPHLILLTHAISIQNIGWKEANGVEVVHRTRPDHFRLDPPLNFSEAVSPTGEHTLRIDTLGRGEFFAIQFLSYITVPELLYIRSAAGRATEIATQHFRVLPRWVQLLSQFATFVGAGLILYWGIKALVFLFRGTGVLPPG